MIGFVAFKWSSAPFNPTVSYAEDFKRLVEFLMRNLIGDSFHCAKYEVTFRLFSTVLLETKKLIKIIFDTTSGDLTYVE